MGFVQKATETQRLWDDRRKGWMIHDPRSGAVIFEPGASYTWSAQRERDRAMLSVPTKIKPICPGCGAPKDATQCSYCKRIQ